MELVSKKDRIENFVIDFTISSIIAMSVIIFTYKNIFIAIFTYYFIRFVYYFCFELCLGKTFGKYETRTKVISSSNQRVFFFKLIFRNLIRFISLSSFVSDNKRLLHDFTSSTFVVKDLILRKIEVKKILDYAISVYVVLSYIFLREGSNSEGGILIIIYFISFVYGVARGVK